MIFAQDCLEIRVFSIISFIVHSSRNHKLSDMRSLFRMKSTTTIKKLISSFRSLCGKKPTGYACGVMGSSPVGFEAFSEDFESLEYARLITHQCQIKTKSTNSSFFFCKRSAD